MNKTSPAQQGIWVGHQLAEDKALYNTAECLIFAGKVSASHLAKALSQVVQECDCLYTHYRQEGHALVRTPATVPVTLRRHERDFALSIEAIRQWAKADLATPFALESELPCRFTLLEGADQDVLYMAAHHIALDGFAYSLFCQRLADVYAALCREEDVSPSHFTPFEAVLDEEEALQSKGIAAAGREFWQKKLAARPEPALLGRHSAPLVAGYEKLSWSMPTALWQALDHYARAIKATWTDVCLAVLSLQVAHRTGVFKQQIGLPVMNRIGSKALMVPCMHMNIVPLCVDLCEDDDLAALAQKIAAARKSLRSFQTYRWEAMLRDLQKHGARRERLFGPVVNILPFPKKMPFGDTSAQREGISVGPVAEFSLSLYWDSPKTPPLFEYLGHRHSLPEHELASLQQEFCALLSAWLAAPTRAGWQLAEGELCRSRAQQLIACDELEVKAPRQLFDWIATRAQEEPERTALVQGARQLSYGALMKAVERWAGALQEEGVGAGSYVGVMMERSCEAIIALLAIWRAGGCYVPLDRKQAPARQAHILAQLDLQYVIVDALPEESLAVPQVLPWQRLEGHGGTARDRSQAQDLAYVLFTSGSTGMPKGVAITMASLSHFVAAANVRYRITAEDRVLQFAPFHFDTSLEEISLSLAHGATLVLRDEFMIGSFTAFAESIAALEISVLDLPTAFWNEWARALADGLAPLPERLRTVILGGEAVHPEYLGKWLAAGGARVRLINSYGPTETTIVATTTDLREQHTKQAAISIGRPLAGVKLLVVGAGDRPAREGELLILGPTVGSHYLAAPTPLAETLAVGELSYRVYRTGDHVRREGDEIHFLGRLDDEFKISGHRIHPHEVEAQLLRLPHVREAAVCGVEEEGGVKRLAAFVGTSHTVDPHELRRALMAALPAPMVPSTIRVMATLPKSSTGKIDRRALMNALSLVPKVQTSKDPALLAQVKAVWQEVLGVADVQEDDNFFDIGGQSLQSIQIAARLSRVLAKNVHVADVLRYPVLGEFCRQAALGTEQERVSSFLRTTALPGPKGGAKLYAFPGIGGSSAQFLALAHAVKDKGQFHVVESPDSSAELAEAKLSLQEWVAACAALLLSQGAAHYRLVGHSFGGCLAFEVARSLEAAGFEVELWLLDSYFHLDRTAIDPKEFLRVLAKETSQDQGGDLAWVPTTDVAALSTQLRFLKTYRPSGVFHGRTWRCYPLETVQSQGADLESIKVQDAHLFQGITSDHQFLGNHFSMLQGQNCGELGALIQKSLGTKVD